MKSRSNPTTRPGSYLATTGEKVAFPLALQAALLVIIVMAVTTWILVHRVSQRAGEELRRQIIHRGRSLVELMAEACTEPLVSEDLLFVESIARKVGRSEAVVEAAIITSIELNTSQQDRRRGVTDIGTYVAHSNPAKIGLPYEYPEGLREEQVGLPLVELRREDGTRALRFRSPLIYPYQGRNRIVGNAEVVMDLEEIDSAVAAVRSSIVMSGLYAAIGAALLIILLFGLLLRPLRRLTDAMGRLMEGDFQLQVIARDPSEVGVLTRTFNHMASELSSLQRKMVEQELIKRELDIAEKIQHALLPEKLPKIEGLDIAAHYSSAEVVGGDYYDIIRLGEHRWAFVVGDVSGKGIPGALVMSMTRSILRSHVEDGYEPAQALIRTNRVLCKDIPPGMFVTLALLYYDTAKHEVVLASAGHNPPLFRRGDVVMPLRRPGLPLGADNTGVFESVIEEGVLPMQPGDLMLLYTDGLTETMNRDGELFGLDRLREALLAYREGPLQNYGLTILRRVSDFRDGYPPSDDVSFIALKCEE